MSNTQNASTAAPIYHEKQSLLLCALHSINNLYQERAFSKPQLNEICSSLSPDAFINPHKSVFGWGNFDVNVLTAAINSRGDSLVWFNLRKGVQRLKTELTGIIGFIVNVPVHHRFWRDGAHWFAVRNIGGVWYNLDSKLEAPEKIKDNDVRSFLGSVVDTDTRAQVMVITTGDTEASSVYMKEEKEGKKEGREENVNERANEKEKERSGKDEEVEANVTTREQKGQDEQPKENGNNAGTTSEKKNETNENTATTEIDENENDGDGDTGEALSTKMQALTV